MKLLNIGFGNYIALERIISVLGVESAPVKRFIREFKAKGDLIDASCGRKTESVLIMDSGHVVLSAFTPENINLKTQKEQAT